MAKIYGCEITKNDRKFKEICKKEAVNIIRVKIRLLKKGKSYIINVKDTDVKVNFKKKS